MSPHKHLATLVGVSLLFGLLGGIAAAQGGPPGGLTFTASNTTQTVHVIQNGPGITNPSFTIQPPAALLGQATSTTASTVGVIGTSAGSFGFGVVGISSGTPVSGENPSGVVGAALSTSGKTRGVSGIIFSPDGIAVDAQSTNGGIAVNAQSTNGGLLFQGVNAPNVQFLVDATGNTRIGSGGLNANLFVTGTIQTSVGTGGSATLCLNNSSVISFCSSSVRYKKDILSLGAGLEVVRRLRPITFRWKEGGQPDIGLIAEEVNSIEPLLVSRNAKGEVEGVKYDRLNVLLINAIQQQQSQIETLRAQNAALSARLRAVENALRKKAGSPKRRR